MMRLLSALLIFSLLLFSCKKVEYKGPPRTIKELIQRIAGTYNTTKYCYQGSYVSGYTYDTTYNVQLTITPDNDSTVLGLPFFGNLATHDYQFMGPISSGGYATRLWIDSTLTTISYSNGSGGLGGGGGCDFEGKKQ